MNKFGRTPFRVELDQRNEGRNEVVVDAEGFIVARIPESFGGPEPKKLDARRARLFAAAPELLEALENMVCMFKESHFDEVASGHYGDDEAGYSCSYCEAIQAAETALTKAGAYKQKNRRK